MFDDFTREFYRNSLLHVQCHIVSWLKSYIIELTFRYRKVVNITNDYMEWVHLDLAFPWCDGKPTNSRGIIKYCLYFLYGNDALAPKTYLIPVIIWWRICCFACNSICTYDIIIISFFNFNICSKIFTLYCATFKDQIFF